MIKRSILHFMDPPPPLGGVTLSVKNLVESINCVGGKAFYRSEDCLFNGYDVGHIHSSNKFKRFFQIIWLKLKCKKVIFTVHGLYFDNILINKLSLFFSDGVIFLNDDLIKYWVSESAKPMVKLPSLFKEGNKINCSCLRKNDRLTDKRILLLYSHSKSYKNEHEVYGIEFALKAIAKAQEQFKIILIDLDEGYAELVDELSSTLDIDYYPCEVNFTEKLKLCDIYLRPTCMDGSSLAVQEALLLGKRVLASDVVERIQGVDLYEFLNTDDFIDGLSRENTSMKKYTLESVDIYLNFLDEICK